MECCLLKQAPEQHKNLKSIHKKLYRVGRLFEGDCLCAWCLLHLQELTKPLYSDTDIYDNEVRKKRFPEYWAIVESVGLEKMRHELKMQIFEAEPDSTPTRPEQLYPKLQVSVTGIRSTNSVKGHG